MSTRLDANQVIKQAFDESTGRLRTDAVLNASGAEIELDAADGDNVAISDGTDTLAINADGSINVVFSGSSQIEISAADGDSISISDGTDTLAVNADGSINVLGTITANPTVYATHIDEASATVTYIGKAAVGSSSASAVWQISKMSVSGTVTSITYADSNSNFDNKWDDRAILSYG